MSIADSPVSLALLEGLCREMRARAELRQPTAPRFEVAIPRGWLKMASRATILLSLLGTLCLTVVELQAGM